MSGKRPPATPPKPLAPPVPINEHREPKPTKPREDTRVPLKNPPPKSPPPRRGEGTIKGK